MYVVPAVVAKLITPPELVNGTAVPPDVTLTVPVFHGLRIFTVPPAVLVTVSGLTLPPVCAALTRKR